MGGPAGELRPRARGPTIQMSHLLLSYLLLLVELERNPDCHEKSFDFFRRSRGQPCAGPPNISANQTPVKQLLNYMPSKVLWPYFV